MYNNKISLYGYYATVQLTGYLNSDAFNVTFANVILYFYVLIMYVFINDILIWKQKLR